jgi:hypothetical protein
VLIASIVFGVSLPTPSRAQAASPSATASATHATFVDSVLRYLGFNPSDRQAVLEKGGVLHSGLSSAKQAPEEVGAVGAMLLVDAPGAATVIDAFLHADTFHEVHQVTRHTLLRAGAPPTADMFADLRFPAASERVPLTADSLGRLNLSAAEAGTFRAVQATPDARTQLRQAMAEVLSSRLGRFEEQGIRGIEPYQRSRGALVRPDQELAAAIASLTAFATDYPGFVASLGMSRPPAEASARYFRLEAPFGSDEVISLSREQRQTFADRAIGADLHFYASSGYNAMLTLVGVAPYDQRWLVFAVNHTFTDEVTGFPADLKRAIARKEIAARIAKHLETVRARVQQRKR